MPTVDFAQAFSNFIAVLRMFKLQDLLDILIVAIVIYYLIQLIRETRAGQLVNGVFAILLLYAVSGFVGFRTLKTIMSYIIRYGAIVMLVLFQPELRKILEQVGRTRVSTFQAFSTGLGTQDQENTEIIKTISAICDSCSLLSKEHIGALIVVERLTKIGDIIATGTVIDSVPSADLIKNIFFPNSPLHDGALVIRSNRLFSAGCFLPLSDNYQISRNLGTRHRAALGMSEVSDALVVVVSEETGNISIANKGRLYQNLSPSGLSAMLYQELLESYGGGMAEKRKFFGRKGKSDESKV